MSGPRHGTVSGLLLVGLSLLAACATRVETVTTLPPTALPKSSWIGHDVTDVISKWGPASEREPDGRGGQILLYDKTTAVMKESPHGVTNPAVPEQTTPLKQVRAKFWVDDKGKVYKIWFADSVYEKGEDLAPPGSVETEDES